MGYAKKINKKICSRKHDENKREKKGVGHMKVQKHSKKREKKRNIAHIQEKE
jgi:hypothetical protein